MLKVELHSQDKLGIIPSAACILGMLFASRRARSGLPSVLVLKVMEVEYLVSWRCNTTYLVPNIETRGV